MRQYGERTAEIHQERQLRVRVQRDPLAIERALRLPGWRVYVINAWQERLSLEQAVLAYREEYLVEPNFGRLKGKPLSLTPMYLQNDQHARG